MYMFSFYKTKQVKVHKLKLFVGDKAWERTFTRSERMHSSEEQAELHSAAADGGAAGSKDPPGI